MCIKLVQDEHRKYKMRGQLEPLFFQVLDEGWRAQEVRQVAPPELSLCEYHGAGQREKDVGSFVIRISSMQRHGCPLCRSSPDHKVAAV